VSALFGLYGVSLCLSAGSSGTAMLLWASKRVFSVQGVVLPLLARGPQIEECLDKSCMFEHGPSTSRRAIDSSDEVCMIVEL
jgi:hypothetical protein